MTQVSVVDDVIAALLDLFADELDIPVYDGLDPTSAAASDFAIVGHDGDPDVLRPEPAGMTEQDLAAFEAGTRTETGSVVGCVVAQSGAMDYAVLRARSLTNMAAVEAALRSAGEDLGGVVANGRITSLQLVQTRNANGAAVRRVWTYSFVAYQG